MNRNPDTMRRRARKKHLDRLYAEQNSLCHWCKSQTVLLKYIDEDKIIEARSEFIIWREGEYVLRARYATIDHVTPISEGGTNDPDNLVMSCSGCNRDRTTQEKIESLCDNCLGPKGKRRRLCVTCSIEKSRQWLTHNGWTEYPTSDDQTKFIDPVTKEHHCLKPACRIQGQRIQKPDFVLDVKLPNNRGPEEELV